MDEFQSSAHFILEEILPIDNSNQPKIIFENASLSGLKEMHRYSVNEKFYEFLEYPAFETINQTKNYLNKLLKSQEDNDGNRVGIVWFIRDINSDNLIGTARLTNIDYNRRCLEWGYGIDPDHWGKGFVFNIQNTLKTYVFEKLKFNRIFGGTRIDNERTKAAVLAAGAIEEGISYQALRDYKGNFHNVWRYCFLSKDYFTLGKDINNELKSNVSKKTLAKIISKTLDLDDDGQTLSMNTQSKWDSLMHIQVIIDIEKKIGYKFNQNEIVEATSLEKIQKIVNHSK